MRAKGGKIKGAILHVILIAVAFCALYPVFIMIVGSFKTAAELAVNASGFPKYPTFDNYRRLLNYNSGIIVRTYFNSIFVSVSYMLLTLFVSSLAAFAFSKYKFRGKNALFVALLFTMMVPAELNMPPMYLLFSRIKWLNTYQVQILPGIANVFALFMLRQYMQSIPDSLTEAARIDGAGHFKVYTDIIIPTTMPAISALGILLFLGKWNEFLFPKLMLDKVKLMPIMLILPNLNEANTTFTVPPWELLLTGCAIVTLPLIVLFTIFQDQFVSSATIGAVKG
jgi:ABC-type glycerol-3-phosphate transport system permease component